jgi:hypothetical protein
VVIGKGNRISDVKHIGSRPRKKCDVCDRRHAGRCPLLDEIGTFNAEKERQFLDQPVQLVDGVLRPVPWEGETRLLRDEEEIATIKPITAPGIRRVLIHTDGRREELPPLKGPDPSWFKPSGESWLASGSFEVPKLWREPTRWQKVAAWLGDRATEFAAWCYRQART